MSKLYDRLKEIEKHVDGANTRKQLEWRKRIVAQIRKYIIASQGDDEKFLSELLVKDFLAWTTWHFSLQGKTLFLTQDQYKIFLEFRNNSRLVCFYPRRAGKSVGLACILLYYAMVLRPGAEVLVLAPTSQQLVLMKRLRDILGSRSAWWLFDKYLGDIVRGGSAKKIEETDSKIPVKFNNDAVWLKNDSKIDAVTLGVNQSGIGKRGFSASCLVLDEFQLVDEDIKNEIIEPIILDAFDKDNEKKLCYIGTPDDEYDIKLAQKWKDAQKPDSGIATLSSNCFRATEQGARKPDDMSRRFRELQIPCRWVLSRGICPRYTKTFYEEETGLEIEPDKENPKLGDVDCGEVCMDNSTFVKEDFATFSKESGLRIPIEHIMACGKEYKFVEFEDLDSDAIRSLDLIMSIDMGDTRADTAILIWSRTFSEKLGMKIGQLKLIYYEIINDERKIGVKNPSVKRIQELYKLLEPSLVIPDATGKKEHMNELLHGADGIPQHAFYTTDLAERNGAVGVWWSGIQKAEMFDHMKECLRNNQIHVPSKEQDMIFWERFQSDLASIRPEPPTVGRPYIRYPSTGHVVDSVAMGCLSIKPSAHEPAYTGAMFGDEIEEFDDIF